MTNENKHGRWFRVWWWDSSNMTGFFEADLPHYAKELDFSAAELLKTGEVNFLDTDGDIVGGVVAEDKA